MLHILGMGWSLPDTEITNDFLHKEVGLQRGPAWVASRLGIERRRSILSKDYILKTKNRDPEQAVLHAKSRGWTPAVLGAAAAREAIRNAGIKASDVGWVIANNDIPFDLVPNTASLIAKELGASGGPHCDINSACPSFALHMKVLDDARPEGLPEFVLCVQISAYTTRTDYSPSSIDGYIFGDGAAAQVVSARHAGRLQVEPLIFETKASGADEITMASTGHFSQNGAAVREFSIRKTCEIFETVAEKKGLFAEDCWTVAHQANHVMQESILGHLGLPAARHLRNVREQGNTAAAGCPSALAQGLDLLHSGDEIVYGVVGAGLAWGGGYMKVL